MAFFAGKLDALRVRTHGDNSAARTDGRYGLTNSFARSTVAFGEA